MKKLSLLVLFLFAAFVLVGCGVSEKYADKVNKAAEKEEYLTYDEVIDDLGEATISPILGIGDVYIWVKGCKNLDEVEDKIDEGKELKALYIKFKDGKAVEAYWDVYGDEKE